MKQGKTTLAMSLARKFGPGIVTWDPRHMIDGVICWGPDELYNAMVNGAYAHGPLVYRFDSRDIISEFSHLCSVIFPPRFSLGHFTLVVDEAAQLQRSNWIHPELDRAVRQHPRSVNIIQTTHSLQDWFRSSRDLVSDLYTFSLMGKSLDACISFTDAGDDEREIIRNLGNHCYAHWDHASANWEVCNDPASWSPVPTVTVESSSITESIQ